MWQQIFIIGRGGVIICLDHRWACGAAAIPVLGVSRIYYDFEYFDLKKKVLNSKQVTVKWHKRAKY